MDLLQALQILKDAKVSHTIDLANNNIGAAGAIGLAEHLKDAKVSHTIDLYQNQIGGEGLAALASMIKDGQFPTIIHLCNDFLNNPLNKVMNGNDAILAIRQPKTFQSKIESIFKTPFPILKLKLYYNDKIGALIIKYLGQEKSK